MRQLKFVGLAEDGESIVLEATDSNELFTLPIDERLRAASRGDLTRLGQIEIELESTLPRPRDIQNRIRAGESPEDIAGSNTRDLPRIERFAYPVLQEREQMAREARRSRVRRGEAGQSRTLGDLVDERLAMRGAEPDKALWDSWRRDDGTWLVTVRWRPDVAQTAVATWSFDLATRSVVPADETATELISDQAKPMRTVTAVTRLAAAAQQVTPARPTPSPVPSIVSLPNTQDVSPTTPPTPHPPQDNHEEDRTKRARVPSWDDILLGVRRR